MTGPAAKRVIDRIRDAEPDSESFDSALHAALLAERESLVDLPEVGAFLLLLPHLGSEPVIDLTDGSVGPSQPDTADDLPDGAEVAAPTDQHTPPERPSAAVGSPPSSGLRSRRAWLRRRRDPARPRRTDRHAPATDVANLPSPPRGDPLQPDGSKALPTSPRAGVDDLDALSRSITAALSAPITVAGLEHHSVGTARPDAHIGRRLAQSITALNRFLHERLGGLQPSLPDDSLCGSARPDPYWQPRVARRASALQAGLRRLLPPTSTIGTVTGETGDLAVGTARPEPYWPTRFPGVHDPPAPHRLDEIEAELTELLGDVGLVGDLDLDRWAHDVELALIRSPARTDITRFATDYPSTLLVHLVIHAVRHPDPSDFEATLPVASWRNAGGRLGEAILDTFDRAVVQDLSEVDEREPIRIRHRAHRRLRLHSALARSSASTVMEAVAETWWDGARATVPLAARWRTTRVGMADRVGPELFTLLTLTDHGLDLLDVMIEMVATAMTETAPERDRFLEPGTGVGPLSARLAPSYWSAALRTAGGRGPVQTLTGRRWTLAVLDDSLGPALVLPKGSDRWHVNGSLLGYSSPTANKTLPLPFNSKGRWTLTVDPSGRRSSVDSVLQSASEEAICLVFDELGRLHDRNLPLVGERATIVAPAGSEATGQHARSALPAPWQDFDRIELSLDEVDERVRVRARGGLQVDIPVDRRMHVLPCRLTATSSDVRFEGVDGSAATPTFPRWRFARQIAPADELHLRVTDADGRESTFRLETDETATACGVRSGGPVPLGCGPIRVSARRGERSESLLTVHVVPALDGAWLADAAPDGLGAQPGSEVRFGELQFGRPVVTGPSRITVGPGGTAPLLLAAPDGSVTPLRVFDRRTHTHSASSLRSGPVAWPTIPDAGGSEPVIHGSDTTTGASDIGALVHRALDIHRRRAGTPGPETAAPPSHEGLPIEQVWQYEPMLAAAMDRTFDPGHEDVVGALHRWHEHTGWLASARPTHAVDAVRSLYRPLWRSLRRLDFGSAAIGSAPGSEEERPRVVLLDPSPWSLDRCRLPCLSLAAWRNALEAEAPSLDRWSRRHHRSIWRWRTGRHDLDHLGDLWSLAKGAGPRRSGLTVVAAASLAASDHPQGRRMTDALADAAVSAPTLVRSAVVAALAHRALLEIVPSLRFQRIVLSPRGVGEEAGPSRSTHRVPE
ncbi:MAG: hypothetical protein R2698_05210 [Microthrixaceae bacterium]